jgi:DNA-binding FrmR family transcriptional regulator
MHEHDRYCIEMLDQLSAARAALNAVALLLLEDHVNGCIREAVDRGEADRRSGELLSTVRRFVRNV